MVFFIRNLRSEKECFSVLPPVSKNYWKIEMIEER